VSHYNAATKEYAKIDKDVTKLTDKQGGGFEELPGVDKPSIDE
jgi:hypothetical protein